MSGDLLSDSPTSAARMQLGDGAGFPTEYQNPREMESAREGARYWATLRDGAPVVVTILSTDLAERLSDRDACVAELRDASARFAHPTLPTPVVAGTTPNGSVHFAIKRSSSSHAVAIGMTAPEAGRLGAQLAQSLHLLHASGGTHGAISTARVVMEDGGPKLEGFGLLKALQAGGLSAAQAAAALSPPGFLAPEAQTGMLDARSDQFSLGAALYELLTGKPPFGGRTTSYVMATVLAAEEGNAVADGPESPVITAVLRAIERAPDDRWPTAQAFAQALATAAGSAPEPAATRKSGCLPAAAALATFIASGAFIFR